MQITFLGTGTSQGVPVIACECAVCLSSDSRDKRLRTSIMIEDKGSVFVIDSGPDFRQQLLRENVKQLDAVIFTHEHKDHIAGLDDVRAFNYKTGRAIDIYLDKAVERAVRRDFHYVFSGSKYPGIPQLNLIEIDTEPFTINNTTFVPINVLHHKMPVKAFRIKDFTYITDANKIEPEEMKKIKGSKIVVVNALRKEDHISHFTFQQAIDLMVELKPEKAYFTHISHQLGKHADVQKELPAFIELATDGLKIEV
ncbi:MAG: MBL fold metallo-hydrolase [Bacteroidia bacterium]|nr:MBL fold metallo-hydrolase [Bacteroidia bacterium]